MIRPFFLFVTLASILSGCEASPPIPPAERDSPPTYGTRTSVIRAMLDLAETTEDDIVYDLGAGVGEIVITASREYGARSVGIEWTDYVVEAARKRAKRAGVAERTTFVHADFFEADFSEATVVTMFLWEDINRRLKPHLLEQLAPGTRVVTHTYPIPGWAPAKTSRALGKDVYLYRIGNS